MPAMPVEDLLERVKTARNAHRHFEALMRDVYQLAMPDRDGWGSYGLGADRHAQVFDSTAIVSASRFANRLQQALFPPGQRWMQLELPPEIPVEGNPDAQALAVDLEAATDLFFRHIAASNFDAAVNEWAHDLGAGAGVLLVENGRLGTRRSRAPLLRFKAVPASSVCYDEGPFGGVEGVFMEQELPARNVPRAYPDADGVPPEMQRIIALEPERKVKLLLATTYDAAEDIWRFEVVDPDSKARFVERRYRTNPWIVTRWSRAPGEITGRGPLTVALPDIRTLNRLMELHLRAAALAVTGVYTATDDGVLNPANVRIIPGAIIPVRSNGGTAGPSLRPLEFPQNYALAEDLRAGLTTRIRQVLFDDPLPPEVQVGLTATEVIERVRRFQQDTGAFGRLMFDAVTPLTLRCLDILDQAGELADERFAGLMDSVRDDAIRIRPTSPLAQAQDMADVQAVMQFLAGAVQLGEAGTIMVRTGVDVNKAGPYVAARMGVPASLIPSSDVIAEEDAAAAEQAQASELLASPVAAQVAGQIAGAAMRPEAGA